MLKFTKRWVFFSKRRPTLHESVTGRSRFISPEETIKHLQERDKDKVFDYFEMKKAGRLAPSAYDYKKEDVKEKNQAKKEKREYIEELKKKGMKIEYHSSTDEEKGVEELINKDYQESYKTEGQDVYGRKVYNDSFDQEIFGLKKWDEYVKKKKEFEPIKPSEWIENIKPEWEEQISSWNLLNQDESFNVNQDVLGTLEKMADEKISNQRENYSVINGNAEIRQNIDVLGELEKMADSKKAFQGQNIGKETEKDNSLNTEGLQNIATDPKQNIFEFAALWLKDIEELHKKLPENKKDQVPKLGSFLDIASSGEFFKKKIMINDEDLYKKEAEESEEKEDEFEDKYKEEDKDTDKDKDEILENLPLRKRKPKRKK